VQLAGVGAAGSGSWTRVAVITKLGYLQVQVSQHQMSSRDPSHQHQRKRQSDLHKKGCMPKGVYLVPLRPIW
jgi:hypothetical protein